MVTEIDGTTAGDFREQADRSDSPGYEAFHGVSTHGTSTVVAEAGDPKPTDTEGKPVEGAPAAAAGTEAQYVPDAGNVVHLPANISVDNIKVVGHDLVLQQADGSAIVVKNGALDVPTFMIGDVELPRVAILAALEASGINVAFGADGSMAAGGESSSNPSSGGEFTDGNTNSAPDATPFTALLNDTTLNFDGIPNQQNLDSFPDTQPVGGLNSLAFLSEGALANGNRDSGDVTSFTGTLAHDYGINGVGSLTLVDVTLPSTGGFSYETSADGLHIIISQNGLHVVRIDLTDSVQGQYTLTLLAPIQHAPGGGENSADFTIGYTVVDNDGDHTPGQLGVSVTDDVPTLSPVIAQTVAESSNPTDHSFVTADATGSLHISWGADNANSNPDGGVSGTPVAGDRSVVFSDGTVTALNGLGLTSNGVALSYALSADGQKLTATAGTHTVFTVSLSDLDAGSYKFSLAGNLDHDTTLPLTFTVNATDGDGDTVQQSFTVNVQDDLPTISGPAATANVSEVALPSDHTPNGHTQVDARSLNVAWGADGSNGHLSFATDGNGHPVVPAGLSSDGVALSYAVQTLASGEEQIVAYKATQTADNPVFIVTLNSPVNPTYIFTLFQNLDHGHGGNSDTTLPLTFTVNATDGDGDTVQQSFTVNVQDDLPTISGPAATADVSEVALPSDHTPNGHTQATAGSLNVAWGADGSNGHLSFATDGQGHPVVPADLKSDGVALSYVVQTLASGEEQIVAYKATQTADNPVFIVTLNSPVNPTYIFTLFQNLDHGHGGGTDNSLPLTFTVNATDGDGDTVQQSFTVNVTDDVPTVAGSVTNSIVGEDGLVGANAAGGSYDGADNAAVAQQALNVNWGADSDIHTGAGDLVGRSLSFDMAGNVPVDGAGHALALSSDGVALQYVMTGLANGGQELQAYRGGTHNASTLVFTVTLDPTAAHGAYSFTLNGNLDHAATGPAGDQLPIGFALTATDADGDSVKTAFTVTVQDDVPVAGTAATTSVNEDDLANGNDLFKETRTVHGDLALSWGADDGAARHILMAANGLPAGLTSDGVAIDYRTTVDGDGNAVVTAYKHGASPDSAAGQVFSLSFNENGSGTYTFKLLGNLDHEVGSNDRALNFAVNATDSDGDTVAQVFTVHVADDTPIAIGTIFDRFVEEEQLAGGNEDRQGAGDGDFSVFGFPVDVTTAHANGLLNIAWGGDDANKNDNGGYNGTQVDGDRSVVFGGTDGAHIGDGTVDATTAAQFLSVSGGNGQIALGDLKSGGVALDYVLSGNGTVLTAYAGTAHDAAHAVFTVTLSDRNGGAYDFQLNGVLDHPVHGASASQEDTLAFDFHFTARDGDGDIATNNFTVNVIDDSPVTAGSAASADLSEVALPSDHTPDGHTQATAGSLNVAWGADGSNAHLSFATDGNGHAIVPAGLSSDGVALSYTVQTLASGEEQIVAYKATQTADNPVFIVTLNSPVNPTYIFTLFQNLDHGAGHDATLPLTFTVNATDGDGDTVQQSFTVNVADDVPVSTGDITAPTVLDDDVHGGNLGGNNDVIDATTATGGAGSLFTVGADGFKSVSLDSESGFKAIIKDAHGVASTENVHWDSVGVVGADGSTTWNGIGATSHATVATLTIGADGSYSFTTFVALVHPNAAVIEENLPLTFHYTVTDGDNDTASGSLTVNVNDDTPVNPQTYRYNDVSESDLSAGTATDTHGFIKTDFGADGFGGGIFTGAVKLDIGGGLAGNESFNLAGGTYTSTKFTSEGREITFKLVDSHTILGYVASADNGGHGDVDVIKLSLSQTDTNVTTTLFQPLDHIAAQDGSPLSTMLVDATITFTDGDGDPITNIMRTTIHDDVPTAAALVRVGLDDDALAGGNPGGIGDGGDSTNASGTLAVHFGADGGTISWLAPTFSSSHQGYSYEIDGGTLKIFQLQDSAATTPVQVLSVTLDPTTGAYEVLQLAAIHHPTGADENEVPFDLNYRVTDGDSDTSDGVIRVVVDDDTPTATLGKLVTQETANADGSFHSEAVTGHLLFSPGADGAKVTAIHYDFGTKIADGDAASFTTVDLKSGGQQVTVTESADHLTLTGKLADGSSVFVIHVTNPATGEYSFTQYAPLDHPDINESGANDPLRMRVSFTVTDGDGDTATNHIQLDIRDDAPVVGDTVAHANLLTNGDFAGVTFAHQESWGQWATEDTGWHISGTVPGQEGVQLERIQSGYLGLTTSDGKPMVDLGATPGDIQISQTIGGLAAGQHYSLSFEAGSSNPASSGLEIYWNGQVVPATVSLTGTMTVYTLDLVAAGGDNTLTFKEIGNASDNVGTYLANVSLIPAGDAALSVFHGDAQENGTQTFQLVSGSDFHFGADGPGSVAFDTAHAIIAAPTGTTLGIPALNYDIATGTLTMMPGHAFDGLSQGEIATLSVPFTVTDGDGDTKSGIYQFTITGTNDGISTSEGFPDHMTMTEYAETDPRAGSTDDRTVFDAPAAGHAGYNGGGFWLYDADQGDTHTITVAPQGSTLGTVEAVVSEETSGDGVGFVTWHYHVSDATLNQLGAGETRDEVFRINIADGNGGAAYRDITVTLVGSEDKPDIFVGQNDTSALFLNETNAGLTGSGTLSVTDVDVTDVVNATVVSVSAGGSGIEHLYTNDFLKSLLTVGTNPVIDGTHTSGEIAWTFNSGAEAFNFLPKGWESVLNYTIEVNDGHGGTDTQVVQIKLHGTNDGPVFGWGETAAPLHEVAGQTGSSAVLTKTGQLLFADADDGDTHSIVSITPTSTNNPDGNYLGHFTASVTREPDHANADAMLHNGQVMWKLTATDGSLDFLAAGQVVTQQYQITLQDASGAQTTQTVTATFTGTNDAPHITVAAGDSDYSFLTETNAGLSAHGTLTATDVDVTDVVNATVVSVSAGGSGIEHLYTNDVLKGMLSVGTNAVIDGAHTSGEITWAFNSGTEAFNFLPNGSESVLNYTIEVNDGHGGTDTQVVQIKLHGTNDVPVISAGGSSGSVSEAGDLGGIVEAGTGGALHLSAALAGQIAANVMATAALAHVLSAPGDVAATITTLMSALGVNEATAIAIVWKTFDGPYQTSPNQLDINEGFTRLGLAYDSYLKDGGSPLVDVTAKYTADGNANGTPDRLQSLHDNLLSNVTDYALHQRYDAVGQYDAMHALVEGQDPALLTRSPQPVTGSESDPAGLAADAHAYDMTHGYASQVTGQLTASDPDAGDTRTWSADHANGTYGTFALDPATGKWTYTLDDTRAATQALGQGDHATESFLATVTDAHGASASQTVTVTVNGTNDAPVITSDTSAARGAVYEAGVLDNAVSANASADHKFSITPHLDPTANSATDPTTANTAADMKAVVTAVQGWIGSHATFADAIATVWDNLDHNYTNYYANAVNKASVLLGLVYADYVQHGGAPLTDVIVKYTPDANNDSIPERSQSLHDNLLGSLDNPSMVDKFLGAGQGSNPNPDLVAYNSLMTQIQAAHLDGRPIYSGNETADPAATKAFDLSHGLLPDVGQHLSVSGQLTASDVDAGDTHAWSIASTIGTPDYGTMHIDPATGKWTFTLDDTATATQALAAGQTATATYVATVTDAAGASASQDVTITIHGTNDVPVAVGDEQNFADTSDIDAGKDFVGSVSVLANDTDVDGDSLHVVTIRPFSPHPLAFSDVSGGSATAHGNYGDLTIHTDGSYTYKVNAAFDALAADSRVDEVFKYGISDPSGSTSTAMLTFHLDGANDAPTAPTDVNNTVNSVAENAAIGTLVNITAQSTDIDGNAVTYALTNDGGGHFAIDPSTGVVTVASALDYETATSHTITVQALDGHGGVSGLSDFTIGVTDVVENTAPIASSETIHTNADIGAHILIPVAALLANDVDSDGDHLTVTSVTGPNATLLADNVQFSVTGASGSFGYQVFDGADTATATATVTHDSTLAYTSANDFLVDTRAAGQNIVGGDGNDILVANTSSGSNLYGDTQYNSDDGTGNDILFGSNIGGDQLFGGGGNDILYGRGGDDKLYGNAGDDHLYGGAGLNTMTGGAGHDTFVIDPSAMHEINMVDVITDFSRSEDVLDLTDLLKALPGGAPTADTLGDFVHLTTSNGGTTVSVDADGAGGSSSLKDVASLTNLTTANAVGHTISILYDDNHTTHPVTIA